MGMLQAEASRILVMDVFQQKEHEDCWVVEEEGEKEGEKEGEEEEINTSSPGRCVVPRGVMHKPLLHSTEVDDHSQCQHTPIRVTSAVCGVG